MVFKATPSGSLTPLYNFSTPLGAFEGGGLVQGKDGNFYGTTFGGGSLGGGTIFKLTPQGQYTALVNFDPNGNNGSSPEDALLQGSDGNFYGTTYRGGSAYYGTVFKVTSEGKLTTLASFNNEINGAYPESGLVQGSDGNLYGTTSNGGAEVAGTIYKVTPQGVLTTLHNFGFGDGAFPNGPLIQARDGNFYGTTSLGGLNGLGTVFKMTPAGRLTILVNFDGTNLADPCAPLIQGADGSFYGITDGGGTFNQGTIFKVTSTGIVTVLINFKDSGESYSTNPLVQAKDGSFYGTTAQGGRYNSGGLFRYNPATIVPVTFNSAATIPITTDSYVIEGSTLDLKLAYAPTPGTTLTVVQNSSAEIAGTFDNLPDGGTITAQYQGKTYSFVATYEGGPSYNSLQLLVENSGTVTLGGLSTVYTGAPQSATATTNPPSLAVNFTYDGSSTPPTATGTYTVVGTINDPNYAGIATGSLIITKATATVTLGSLTTTYNGAPQSATATTTPPGLDVNFTYNGKATAPTNAGSYTVVGTVSDPNYTGSATGTLVIAPTTATITLGNLAATYTGGVVSATATTTPPGQPVNFAYTQNGSAVRPINVGSYDVLATVDTTNTTGTATGTLDISPAPATVTVANTTTAYTGKPIPATATTVPARLPLSFTYNGSATAPTATGTYTVVATVTNSNYTGSGTGTLTITPPVARVVLGDLAQTYTGSPLGVTVTTVPASLESSVTVTYNGSSTVPTNAGSYPVVATVNSPDYIGSATGTLVIAKAAGKVTLANLAATYSGNTIAATATTTPSGLTVGLTYNGSSTAPTTAGTYTVVGTINDPNYTGTASGSLIITKATATVTLGNLVVTYNGSPQAATATTNPPSLDVLFTYSRSSTAPTNAGSYAVVGTVSDPNYSGSATGTLVIAPTTATITLGNLAATYTGRAIAVTATTTPPGQPVVVAYTQSGKAATPVNVGSYDVLATVNTTNTTGTATGTLVISAATATVTVANTTTAYTGKPITATAITVPARLPLSFTYNGSAIAPTNTGTYTVIATVTNPNYTGSGTGTLTITPLPPIPATGAATLLTTTGATLNGTVDPQGSVTNASFQYGTTTAYGLTASVATPLSGSTAQSVSASISGLVPGTVYHYRVVGSSAGGTIDGADRTLLTLGPGYPSPAQSYQAASGAQVTLSINPNRVATSVYVEYGISSGDYTAQTASQSIGAGGAPVSFSAFLSGLTPSTTYYYQVVITSSAGTFTTTEQSFTTLSFETSEVAATGEAAPGTTSTWSNLGNPAVNSTDGVAFVAKTASHLVGIWSNPPSTNSLTLVALTGTTAPGTSGVFSALSDPVYNNNADVAFVGVESGNTGVWVTNSGTLGLAAIVGEAAPGTVGPTLGSINALGLTESGDVVFDGYLAGQGTTAKNDFGVWEGATAANVTLELRSGETTNTGKLINSFGFMPTDEIVVNGQTRQFGPATGHLTALANYSDGTTGVIKVVTPTQPLSAATSGDTAPGTSGAEFAAFSNPAINDQDHVTFAAYLKVGVGGITNATLGGIWAENSTGSLTLVTQLGNVAPGTGTNAAFDSLTDPISNDHDAVAFVGTLTTGAGKATAATDTGIWCTSTGSLALVAQAGSQAPGCNTGVVFASFGELALDNSGGATQQGGAIFTAILTGTGVNSSNNGGIFAVDATGTLQLIVRTGQELNGKTISSLSFLPLETIVNGQSRNFSLLSGDLVYGATFTDSSQAILNVVFP